MVFFVWAPRMPASRAVRLLDPPRGRHRGDAHGKLARGGGRGGHDVAPGARALGRPGLGDADQVQLHHHPGVAAPSPRDRGPARVRVHTFEHSNMFSSRVYIVGVVCWDCIFFDFDFDFFGGDSAECTHRRPGMAIGWVGTTRSLHKALTSAPPAWVMPPLDIQVQRPARRRRPTPRRPGRPPAAGGRLQVVQAQPSPRPHV